jgi:hypothetical protein
MIGKQVRFVLLLWLSISGYSQDSHSPKICESAPIVTISDANPLKNTGVKLKWKIFNPSETPIFVYSTFLENRRAAAWVKRQDGVLEIHTSLPAKLNMTAYSYPEAAFIRIEPKTMREGIFIDPKPTIHAHKSNQLVFTVAFGVEVERVKQALRDHFYHGEGHPANPIVDWQCIATSNVTQVQ